MSASKRIKTDHEGEDGTDREEPADDAARSAISIESLSVDEIAIVFGYLSLGDILRARVCNKKFKDATVHTLVPPSFIERGGRLIPEYVVNSTRAYGALTSWMARDLPNLQQVHVGGHPACLRFERGDHPLSNPVPSRLSSEPACQISLLANFQKLSRLSLISVNLNGSYPALFGFRYLKTLNIEYADLLLCNLEEMTGNMPILEDISCISIKRMGGDLKSLRKLKTTLRRVCISCCSIVKGEFMDLSDFGNLKQVDFIGSPNVTGDVRTIKEGDFTALRELSLPSSVFGGCAFDFDQVADVPEVMTVLCRMRTQNGTLANASHLLPTKKWSLSKWSADHYHTDIFSLLEPPFSIEIVEAGPRIGWRWTNNRRGGCCETNWYGPEPGEGSADRADYLRDLFSIQANVRSYRGFYRPPTEEEYGRLNTHW